MGGGVLRLGGDRRVEMGDGFAMPAPGGGDHAEVVNDSRMAGRKPKRVAVGGFRLIELPRFVMRDRAGDQLLEGARHETAKVKTAKMTAAETLADQTPADAATSGSFSMSASCTAPISSVTFLMPRSSHQASRSSMIWTSAVGLRKPA